MTDPARDLGIDDVYSQLETVSRRAVARARHKSAPLTFVEHSLVTYIATHDDCRAIDIAADFGLNRSTVSRQLAHLAELGLVEPQPTEEARPAGPASRRGQVLTLTARGHEMLARSVDANRRALADRLDGWSEAEVAVLASALRRLNSAFVD